MLTLQYIPFAEIEPLSSERRVQRLLVSLKKNKVVLMQGRLRPEEEAQLIQQTMEEVNKDFKGIELCTIYPQKRKAEGHVGRQLKQAVVNLFMGDREGMTIIGPASVVKEIKRNPDKVELLTYSLRRRVRNGGGK